MTEGLTSAGRIVLLWGQVRHMKLTYDPRYNIAYLRLREKAAGVETISASDSVNIDISPDGTLYGIELVNANEQLFTGEEDAFVVVNEARQDQREVALR